MDEDADTSMMEPVYASGGLPLPIPAHLTPPSLKSHRYHNKSFDSSIHMGSVSPELFPDGSGDESEEELDQYGTSFNDSRYISGDESNSGDELEGQSQLPLASPPRFTQSQSELIPSPGVVRHPVGLKLEMAENPFSPDRHGIRTARKNPSRNVCSFSLDGDEFQGMPEESKEQSKLR